ncbi:MAG: amidase, partial [Cyanobacteria bacterium P01_F01_bin.3]
LRSRTLSSVELVQEHLTQIKARNPALNAIITLNAENALQQAAAADAALARGERWGALHGLPMTVKDAFSTAELRTTFGHPDALDNLPKTDAAVVAAVKQSGAIILGKTNIPTLSYDWQCQHPTAGRANNPWNLERTPGGSSGGAATALAAGLTPLELGSDVAGSIRLPAHFYGVCGLRPTEGSLPDAGHMAMPGKPHTIRSLTVVGPMARTIEDLQLLLSVLQQYSRNHAQSKGPISQRSPLAPETDLTSLKLAWTPQIGEIPTSSETKKVLNTFRESLCAAGCQVEEVAIPRIDWEELLELWGLIQGCELSAYLPAAIRRTPLRHLLPQLYWRQRIGNSRLASYLASGMALSVDEYLQLLDRRDGIIQTMDTFLSAYDGWLAPVAPTVAIAHRKPGTPIEINGNDYAYADSFGLYLAATAVLATPAVSFPIGFARSGLPVGVQLHGRRWRDESVLAIAKEIQKNLNRFFKLL